MKKTKGKVLSLILASALIVSSFSTSLVSAATSRETGILNADEDTLYLASDPDSQTADGVDLASLLVNVSVETYDHDTTAAPEFVSYTHASGDRLVKIDSDGYLFVRKDVSGKEVITVTYEADYTRNDKDVVVRASKDITVYADKIGEDFIAAVDSDITSTTPVVTDRPDSYSSAAVNDDILKLGVYTVDKDTDGVTAKYALSSTTFSTTSGDAHEVKFSKTSSKVFDVDNIDVTTTVGVISVDLKNNATTDLAPTGTETLKVKLGQDTSFTDYKLTVAKKWRVSGTSEINKKSGTTYINKTTNNIPDWDDWDTTEKAKAQAITGYEIALGTNALTVKGGSVGNVTGSGGSTVTVEAGSVGDVKATTVSVEDGSVGTIKVTGTAPSIDITGGKVKAIDAKSAVVTIDGGTISGNVVGKTVAIDSGDEDITTTISGNVTAKDSDDPTITLDSSSDAKVEVTGSVKGAVTLTSENVTVGAVDADYVNDVAFEGFIGKLALKNTDDVAITVDGDSEVNASGKVTADTLTIDDGGKFMVEEGYFNSVDGDGTLGVPAGKLFIEDSMVDVTLQLTSGLVAGATAFEAYTDAVGPDDFVALGYSVDQKAKNDDVDKFVIKSVTFAGLAFDKTELSIAKGYEEKVTLSNYPDGTALPEGAQIEWAIDGNDDYITLTVEGNVGTIKVTDYNADYATDNKATVTATVVDEDGNEYDDYVVATAKVTGTALPASTLTLDTKTATVGVAGLYQFLAKSSSGAVVTAVSSDTQIATVTPYDLLDPRGAKFSVTGVAEGKATITATDANGATASFEVTVVKVNGTLKADTTSYKFAPGNVYDVKFTVTGSTATPVVTANGKVVSVVSRGNGVYRVTALNPGTAWVQASVGNARVSITFVVENGATAGGVRGNNVSNL